MKKPKPPKILDKIVDTVLKYKSKKNAKRRRGKKHA